MPSSNAPLEKIEKIIQAWESHDPKATFSAMTLDKFKEAVKPSSDVRQELSEVATRTVGLKAKRAAVDVTSRATMDRVVAGVRGDPAHGPDSALWAAMGFTRLSDRSTGLTRKVKVAVAKTGDKTAADKPADDSKTGDSA